MGDDSFPEPERPHVPAWMRASHRPPLNRYVTAICWILLSICVASIFIHTISDARFLDLENPALYVTMVGEVGLLLEEGLKTAPPWEQKFNHFLHGTGSDFHSEVLIAYQEAARYLDENPKAGKEPWMSGLYSRIAYLQAEAGDWDHLAVPELSPERSGAQLALVTALHRAFASPVGSEGSTVGWEKALPDIHHRQLVTSWTEEMLGARLAEVDGNQMGLAQRIARLERAGGSLLHRLRLIDAAFMATVLAGLCVFVARKEWFTHSVNAARGLTVPPWSFQYGVNVLLRCFAGAICVIIALSAVSPYFLNLASLATGIPMILIANAYLCRPDNLSFTSVFGISMGDMSLGRLTLFALGLSAATLLGSFLIQSVAVVLSVQSPWEEFTLEPILTGSAWQAGLFTFDGLVAAPIMEEIACRGILYVTLRAKYKASISAMLSAGIFAALHLYSVVGFLEVFWIGLVLAVGYEKCRSLYPCIFAHAVNNLLVFATLWLFFR